MSNRDGINSEAETWNGGVFSHFPFLASAIQQTTGPILECGAGWGSTPLIHYMANGRNVVTVETDKDWLSRFNGYRTMTHTLERLSPETLDHHALIEAWTEYAKRVSTVRWGVVFLDQAPGESRVPVATVLKHSAEFIVCHDTCADRPGSGGNYGWVHLEGHFKYRSVVERIRPSTTIYSNVREFKLEPCDA